MEVNTTHSATGSDPVGQGQARQPYGHRHHHQQLHRRGLLPQTRQVFIPDTQQLLLAVGMSHKLCGRAEKEDSSVSLLFVLAGVLEKFL